MPVSRTKLDFQKSIVAKHLSDDNPLLKKYKTTSTGVSTGYSASYDLVGLAKGSLQKGGFDFLPHLEYSVGAYSLFTPAGFSYGGTVHFGPKGISHDASDKGGNVVSVSLTSIDDLFYVRNLVLDGKIPNITRTSKGELPINDADIRAGFNFRVSSTTYGQLVSRMDVDNPEAEEIISQYLCIIDKRFGEYRELEKHFRKTDDAGKMLWEDQGLQSRGYNHARQRLHKALFGEVTGLFRSKGLKHRFA